MPTIRVAIAGATGYAGEELIRLLLQHPHIRLTHLAASAKWVHPRPAADVFPRFAGRLDLPVESLDPTRLASSSDAVFLAMPHGESMRLVPALLQAGKRIIDLGGDFRLKDPALYPRWYTFEHAAAQWLGHRDVAYGLTEFHREEIQRAKLVANPGCYATSILLGCLPLFLYGIAEDNRFIVDAKSGLTGAGKKNETKLFFAEMSGNLRAYKVNEHHQMPEVLQEIERLTRCKPLMAFVPQVIPVSRGLMSTLYVRTRRKLDEVYDAFRHAYPSSSAPFVRVRPMALPELKDVVETNFCDIGITYDPSTEYLIVMSAIDNLTKGAAGQAIQNFNLMHGFPETTALL